METYVNVLGTDYKIKTGVDASTDPALSQNFGYCDYTSKTIIVADYESILQLTEGNTTLGYDNPDSFVRGVIRHELIHAFLQESGLMGCSWATNEEMVDWIALQYPKLENLFNQIGVNK